MDTTYDAAWVPDDDPHRDWEDAAEFAVGWVEGACAEQGAAAVLVTNALRLSGAQPRWPQRRA